MNILELEKFKIEDAINFHDEYNPWLFDGDHLKPVIKKQLETIADDFIEFMGIPELAIEDIIITGSNVAYTYTSHSDIDLHLLVDFAKLPESDVYKELFNAKKSLYNDTYEITIRDIPVEVYVQDTAQSHTSLGEYSLYKDMFTRVPTKKRANLDEISAASKFERLEQLALEGLKSDDIEKVNGVLSIIKRYRQSGLDNKGEFGPENLAFKAVRSKGYFQALFDRRNKLRAEQLSLEEEMLRRTFEESIGIYEQELELSEEGVSEELGEYGTGMLARRYKVDRKEIAKQIDLGVRLEMRHNSKVSAITPELRREQASEIARNNIAKRLDYYQHYDKHMNESEELVENPLLVAAGHVLRGLASQGWKHGAKAGAKGAAKFTATKTGQRVAGKVGANTVKNVGVAGGKIAGGAAGLTADAYLVNKLTDKYGENEVSNVLQQAQAGKKQMFTDMLNKAILTGVISTDELDSAMGMYDTVEESLRYSLDQAYDEYGMPDYTKYLNAISNFVKMTKSKSEIKNRLLKQFSEIDKRDAEDLLSRWIMVNYTKNKSSSTNNFTSE
tara:strand:+ start:2312 stop:3985 length:1674 start_codon:yes stop_codon:yes gene_type:complete